MRISQRPTFARSTRALLSLHVRLTRRLAVSRISHYGHSSMRDGKHILMAQPDIAGEIRGYQPCASWVVKTGMGREFCVGVVSSRLLHVTILSTFPSSFSLNGHTGIFIQ